VPDNRATPTHTRTDVYVHYHFGIPALWIAGGLAGTSHEATHSGFKMRLSFPRDAGDFGIREHDARHDHRLVTGWIDDHEGHRLAEAVEMVRVTVECTLPFGADDIGDGRRPPDSVFDDGVAVLKAAANAARGLVRDYLDLIRAEHGQHWLGLSGSRHRVIWLTEVREQKTDRWVKVGYNDPLSVLTVSSDRALSFDDHRKAIAQASLGERPALSDALIADAKYLASSHSDPPQPREAVLLAAIACEVTIKRTLRAACSNAALPVLDWALDNPRDVSEQAAGLFDKTAKAVTGRSLREENRAVYKGLVALFQDRNKVAHRGQEIEPSVAETHLIHATEAMAWAAELVPAVPATLDMTLPQPRDAATERIDTNEPQPVDPS
jgi:hypothetical protein